MPQYPIAGVVPWLAVAAVALTSRLLADEPVAPNGDPAHVLPSLAWEERSDWINVKADVSPKAIGDGLADDTAAIQAAFALIANGVTVYLPSGTYRIRQTLMLGGPIQRAGDQRLIGCLVVGHGRATRLVWDGPPGGAMIREDGLAYSRWVGLVFDGKGQAAVGLLHDNGDHAFETEVRHQHLGFVGFTDAGILVPPTRKQALAETSFENCLFVTCRRGVSFTQFNDYDYTFDGCEFRDSEIAIECAHGNFYVRNCRFERSTVADILANPEHASSIRRCVSVGSKALIRFSNPVAPLTLQDCLVSGWTDTGGAAQLSGAPALVFDCQFLDGPQGSAPLSLGGRQILIASQNTVAGGGVLVAGDQARIRTIPAGRRRGVGLTTDTRYLKREVPIPGKVFDAQRDFGAKGDGNTDDTTAIQRAIDAAREAGQGGIAYLPTGSYVVTAPLHVNGKDFSVGGSGFRTSLVWRGPEGGTIIEVGDAQNVTIEHIAVGNHDSGQMNNAIDIHQRGGTQASRLTYDGVFVYGMYQKKPLRKGLWLDGLGGEAVVLMPHVQGNIHIADSAAATLLSGMSFEGSIIVDGKGPQRGGLLAFQTRLSTLTTYGLCLKDSQSIVMSDYYIEQADNGCILEGQAGDPPGRATIQGAKIHFNNEAQGRALQINNYCGELFLGPDQFYIEPKDVRVLHTGEQPFTLYLLGIFFYNTALDFMAEPSTRLVRLGNQADTGDVPDACPPEALERLTWALDDLRRLGEADWRLNYPGLVGETP